jgi:hypothetical protein
VAQHQSYETEITPDLGYLISGVTVTMGGVDITGNVFTGTEHVVKHSVSKTLNNSSANNSKSQIAEGESYAAIITPDTDYEITGITVTMGGTDITSSAVTLTE